ncbi:MAG: hypothetical protein AB7K09_18230 [Planctomycetota bacterium]
MKEFGDELAQWPTHVSPRHAPVRGATTQDAGPKIVIDNFNAWCQEFVHETEVKDHGGAQKRCLIPRFRLMGANNPPELTGLDLTLTMGTWTNNYKLKIVP